MNPNPVQQPGDEELIRRFLENDTDAFTELYERHRRILYVHLHRLLPGRDSGTVDDIFQQTWLKALNALPEFKRREKFLPWLLTIAHNLALDLIRAPAENQQEVPDDEAGGVADPKGSTPWGELDRKELGTLLDEAIASLSPELREVFLLPPGGCQLQGNRKHPELPCWNRHLQNALRFGKAQKTY